MKKEHHHKTVEDLEKKKELEAVEKTGMIIVSSDVFHNTVDGWTEEDNEHE